MARREYNWRVGQWRPRLFYLGLLVYLLAGFSGSLFRLAAASAVFVVVTVYLAGGTIRLLSKYDGRKAVVVDMPLEILDWFRWLKKPWAVFDRLTSQKVSLNEYLWE